MTEQRTLPGVTEHWRKFLDGNPGLLAAQIYTPELRRLLDDADALAGALAEVARLRAALDSIEARVNRWYWDDLDASALEAIDEVQRIAHAALKPETKEETSNG